MSAKNELRVFQNPVCQDAGVGDEREFPVVHEDHDFGFEIQSWRSGAQTEIQIHAAMAAGDFALRASRHVLRANGFSGVLLEAKF
jgi:hypothetical protein